MTAKRPNDVPLKDWSPGWLKMETSRILMMHFDIQYYLVMTDQEKVKAELPVTNEEMRQFIKEQRAMGNA